MDGNGTKCSKEDCDGGGGGGRCLRGVEMIGKTQDQSGNNQTNLGFACLSKADVI